MKVLIVNFSNNKGGASQSAKRLNLALIDHGIESKMLVKHSYPEEPLSNSHIKQDNWLLNLINNLLNSLENIFMRIIRKPRNSFSYSAFGNLGIVKTINHYNADIVNLHWVCGNMLSIRDIKRIKAPVVWTLHDIWAFSSGRHIFPRQEGQNYLMKLKNEEKGYWYSLKKKHISKKDNLNLIAPSKWIASISKSSELFKFRSHHYIPNLPNKDYLNFDLSADKKASKITLKKKNIVNLPHDKKIILFGAMNPISDDNKGFMLLQKALLHLESNNYSLHIFGINNKQEETKLRELIPQALSSNFKCSLLPETYGSCDLVVVPSYQENLSNVIFEALTCGRPVVAFEIGGNNDLIDHKNNGYLAKPYDHLDLANGIKWILNHPNPLALESAAREKISDEFSYDKIASSHIDLFNNIIETSKYVNKRAI